MFLKRTAWLLWICLLCGGGAVAESQSLPRFDFKDAKTLAEWTPAHDVAALQAVGEGMAITVTGDDPYVHSPLRAYPAQQPLWLHIRLKSTQSGMAQAFYFTKERYAEEAKSIKFAVPAGKWVDIKAPLPAVNPQTHLRLDPPGTKGNRVVIEMIRFEPRIASPPPALPAFVAPHLQADAPTLRVGKMIFQHARESYGAFRVLYEGKVVGVGLPQNLVGYLKDGKAHWLNITEKGATTTEIAENGLKVTTRFTDDDGGAWSMTQTFTPVQTPPSIAIEARATASKPRNILYLPLFVVSAGVGTYGAKKEHALFAGLEYLDGDEPSSSEADLIGEQSQRQVPDSKKITFPLMAVQAQGSYLALSWSRAPQISAVFDSPDRIFKTGGHVMGLIFPGSDGLNRQESRLAPYDGATVDANEAVSLSGALFVGQGESVVPAVQHYVQYANLPRPETLKIDLPTYVQTAAAGWLDSAIHTGARFRHAHGGQFPPSVVADAPVFMNWLAEETQSPALATRLRDASEKAMAEVPASEWNVAAISHVHYPNVTLLYRQALAGAEAAEARGKSILGKFPANGEILYHKSPDGLDYGKTHFEKTANGLIAPTVANLLQQALLSGDATLITEGVRLLRSLDRFRNTAPRGAQTWEVPLHTPDVLASAHLVNAYLRGYELTGEAHFLEMAEYWAWTGVPFVYLSAPTENPVGLYATTPVFGATQWVSPNWIGLPVQWCGLVYSDALYRLSRYAPEGIWRRVAEGITRSGIQQTWSLQSDPERQGLLPDSFNLAAQVRNDAAINPGTLQASAIRLFRDKRGASREIYDYHVFRKEGVIAHAPGRISAAKSEEGGVSFSVTHWLPKPYQLLIVGLKRPPTATVNGKPATCDYAKETGRLAITVQGDAQVVVKL